MRTAVALFVWLVAPITHAAYAQQSVTARDSLALVSLFHATDGPNWAIQDGPGGRGDWVFLGNDENQPLLVSLWGGVGTEAALVTSVSLFRAGLNGQLPDGLGNLTAPELIAITSNSGDNGNLHGSIPDTLGSLTSLVRLSLRTNMLTGAIPVEIGRLQNLTHLDLGQNQLTGAIPDTLGSLALLEQLQLQENMLDEAIPPDLGDLINLQTLDLGFNMLTGQIPPSLGNLNHLVTLNLGRNRLTGPIPEEFGGLVALRSLKIDGLGDGSENQLTGTIPASLGALTDLLLLSLGGNDLEGPIPESFGSLENLELLWLGFNRLTRLPESITNVTTLQQINLHENDLEWIPDISDMPNLKAVRLFGNRLTFRHLEPLAELIDDPDVTTFFYAPQDDVDLIAENTGDGVRLRMSVGGEKTIYSWFRDDIEIVGEADSMYTVRPGEAGVFRAVATNPQLPDLILNSRPAEPFPATIFTVNSEADSDLRDDPDVGVCDTSGEINRGGEFEPECTLRAAIEALNVLGASIGHSGSDLVAHIVFDVPGRRNVHIRPETSLPPVEYPVSIDGFSEVGDHFVRLDGTFLTTSAIVLDIRGSGSRINRLLISGRLENNPTQGGIRLVEVADVTIEGNTLTGLGVANPIVGGSGNRIVDNVCSGNVVCIAVVKGRGNVIESNMIGVESDGLTPLPNEVGVQINQSSENLVTGNTIASNRTIGIQLIALHTEAHRRNRIVGNLIGTTAAAADPEDLPPLGNGTGILVRRGFLETEIRGNTVSNNGAGITNLADDTKVEDNRVGTDPSGDIDEGNQRFGVWTSGNGTTLRGNTISGNGESGVEVNSSGFTIEDNRIGTDADGVVAIPNDQDGINVGKGKHNGVIRNNVISGNRRDGIFYDAERETPSSPGVVSVFGNRIGTDAAGLQTIGNGEYGIRSNGPAFSNIESNVISANGSGGLFLSNSRAHFTLKNNFVGSTIFGGLDSDLNIPNKGNGAFLSATWDPEISGNYFAYNRGNGLHLSDIAGFEVTGNTFLDNDEAGLFVDHAIGVIEGNSGIENDSGTGIHVESGDVEITGNLLTGDAGDGITLGSTATAIVSRNNIHGNTGLGLNNLNPDAVVAAGSNWWGDASGPAGSGPGSGDAVSSNVDFSNWRAGPVEIVVSADRSVTPIPPGRTDSVGVRVRNYSSPESMVEVRIGDDLGWYAGPANFTIEHSDLRGAAARLPVQLPGAVDDGTTSTFEVIATDQADAGRSDTTTFSVVATSSILAAISVSPSEQSIAPGDTLVFWAVGLDQYGDVLDVPVVWSATGGEIDQDGVYYSGATPGEYTVTTTHIVSGIEGSVTVHSAVHTSTDEPERLPSTTVLNPNYPNPFNPTTTIPFELADGGHVRLAVFDLIGREIAVLIDGRRPAGRHSAVFDANRLPSGVYFYRLTTPSGGRTRSMVLIR